jgi:hypothetical protein
MKKKNTTHLFILLRMVNKMINELQSKLLQIFNTPELAGILIIVKTSSKIEQASEFTIIIQCKG